MNVVALLEMVASVRPDGIAVAPDTTYQALYDAAGRGAAAIVDRGIRQVVYVASNGTTLPMALFASAWAGVPFVPLNYRLAHDQIAAILDRHDGTLLVEDVPSDLADRPSVACALAADRWSELLDGSTSEPPPVDDDDEAVAVYLYTSGTTGAPKAVVLRHRHLVSYILNNVELLSAGDDEAMLVAVPPYHIAGVANLVSAVFAGRRLVYLERFTEADWLSTVHRAGVTHAMVVPTMLARLVRELEERSETAPRSLRFVSYGGAKTPIGVLERALIRFPHVDFVNAYGLTETSSTIAVLGPEDHRAARDGDPIALRRLGSVGRVLDSVRIRITDESGREVPPGDLGQVAVAGDQVSGEYLGTGRVTTDDGWYRTRDIGWMDDDGYLFLQGRADDTIIRGGENIAPTDIEAVLREHPSIEDVAVVGVPDEEWGERLVAVVVAPSSDGTELRRWSLERLRTSMAPEEFIIREALPYSDTGKLLRREVREIAISTHG